MDNLQANRCPYCCGEMETHPVDDKKQDCPSCAIDDTARGEPAFAKAVQLGNTQRMLGMLAASQAPGEVLPCMHRTLPQQLSDLIGKVFDNEEAFLAEFFPGGIGVDEFYMAGERCRVVLQKRHRPINPKLLNIDYPATTTIKTADFLAWAEGLDNQQTSN